jgi:hypothetical protein
MGPIVFTHTIITVAPSKESAVVSGHYATIHVCAGPGNENFVALLYGKVLPESSRAASIILPKLSLRRGIRKVEHGEAEGKMAIEMSLIPQFGGTVLDTIAKIAGNAVDAVMRAKKGLHPGRQYRVSLTGEVEEIAQEAKENKAK